MADLFEQISTYLHGPQETILTLCPHCAAMHPAGTVQDCPRAPKRWAWCRQWSTPVMPGLAFEYMHEACRPPLTHEEPSSYVTEVWRRLLVREIADGVECTKCGERIHNA